MTQQKNTFTQRDLNQFTGTEQYYLHSFGMLYTDGIQFVAENAGGGAYWLLNIIGTVGIKKNEIPFQVWTLVVDNDETAVLTMQEDKDTPVLFKKKINYTDFPIGEWKFWLIESILILPSEY